MFTCIFETGMEVRPRRALEAFCRCEQTWARLTRDIVVVGRPAWAWGWGGVFDDDY